MYTYIYNIILNLYSKLKKNNNVKEQVNINNTFSVLLALKKDSYKPVYFVMRERDLGKSNMDFNFKESESKDLLVYLRKALEKTFIFEKSNWRIINFFLRNLAYKKKKFYDLLFFLFFCFVLVLFYFGYFVEIFESLFGFNYKSTNLVISHFPELNRHCSSELKQLNAFLVPINLFTELWSWQKHLHHHMYFFGIQTSEKTAIEFLNSLKSTRIRPIYAFHTDGQFFNFIISDLHLLSDVFYIQYHALLNFLYKNIYEDFLLTNFIYDSIKYFNEINGLEVESGILEYSFWYSWGLFYKQIFLNFNNNNICFLEEDDLILLKDLNFKNYLSGLTNQTEVSHSPLTISEDYWQKATIKNENFYSPIRDLLDGYFRYISWDVWELYTIERAYRRVYFESYIETPDILMQDLLPRRTYPIPRQLMREDDTEELISFDREWVTFQNFLDEEYYYVSANKEVESTIDAYYNLITRQYSRKGLLCVTYKSVTPHWLFLEGGEYEFWINDDDGYDVW